MHFLCQWSASQAPRAHQWIEEVFHRYDWSLVSTFQLDSGSRRYRGVYGRCHYPTPRLPSYRIVCHAPGPFPCRIRIRKPPLYPRTDGTFPKAPRGCRRTQGFFDPRTGRTWYRVVGWTELRSLDEAIVWIVAHEAFHYLRRTRQIPGRNDEIRADAFADAELDASRQHHLQPTPSLAVRVMQTLFK